MSADTLNLIREGGIFLLVLLGSLTIHEWAHAWVADKLGDPTPRSQGRVTLSPTAHLDWIGSVLIPALNIFVLKSISLIGWGRPVMVNPSYFRNRVRDHLLTVIAGPASNLCIGLLAAIVLRFLPDGLEVESLFFTVLATNVCLAVFNLLPIPPLDGGWLLKYAIGMREETFMKISFYMSWGMLILINLPPFQRLLGFLMQAALVPFALLASS